MVIVASHTPAPLYLPFSSRACHGKRGLSYTCACLPIFPSLLTLALVDMESHTPMPFYLSFSLNPCQVKLRWHVIHLCPPIFPSLLTLAVINVSSHTAMPLYLPFSLNPCQVNMASHTPMPLYLPFSHNPCQVFCFVDPFFVTSFFSVIPWFFYGFFPFDFFSSASPFAVKRSEERMHSLYFSQQIKMQMKEMS